MSLIKKNRSGDESPENPESNPLRGKVLFRSRDDHRSAGPSDPPLPESGAPLPPENQLESAELIAHYRHLAAESQDALNKMHSEMIQQAQLQQAGMHAEFQQALNQLTEQFQEKLNLVYGISAERRTLHQLWSQATDQQLVELFRLADKVELVSCLDGAPIALVARFLAIEPNLTEVVPSDPAPLAELALLWRGLAG